MIVCHMVSSQLNTGNALWKPTCGKVEDTDEISLIPNQDMLKMINIKHNEN